jgi:hypothetical protein
MHLNVGGVTLFVPDTQGFDVDTSKGNLNFNFSVVLFYWRHKGD